MGSKVKKMLVLNPEKYDDKILIEYLEKKKFSQYIRRLIEDDMNKNIGNTKTDEIKSLLQKVLERMDETKDNTEIANESINIKEDQKNQKALEDTIINEAFESKEDIEFSEEDEATLEMFQEFMGG